MKSILESSCSVCAVHAHCKPQQLSTKSSKPAIKSIILSANNNQSLDTLSLKHLQIKQEPIDDENEMSHINVPKTLKRNGKSRKKTVNLEHITRSGANATSSTFTPPRDFIQLKTNEMLGKMSSVASDYRLSPHIRNHSKKQNRPKSPGRRHSSRRKSRSTDRSTRSSDSERYSRRSSSRESTPRRSRSRRSLSRRSVSRESRSRSRSRHSRDTRSYGSTTSTTSSDSDRRSNSRYRDQHDAGNGKRKSVDYHDTNSRGNQNKHRSKSPIVCERKAFNYKNSIMSVSQRNNFRIEKPSVMPLKRFAGATFVVGNQGPETSKKFAIKPQPIVKLHSEPGTDSEDDGNIEREYEELLTFETNEDERREQRLLKALSDIAAKAKQKIQSITNESNNVNGLPTILPTIVNNIHHDISPKTMDVKPYRNIVRTDSNDKSNNERRSTSYHNDDYSPKSKHVSRRSRKDDDGNSKGAKTP